MQKGLTLGRLHPPDGAYNVNIKLYPGGGARKDTTARGIDMGADQGIP